jgi:NDP-4-keto-2,6-dideoxyhexose 3-C-methyltransferase
MIAGCAGNMRTFSMDCAIDQCRLCGNRELEPILDLGLQHLTGVFPRSNAEQPPAAPLELVKCHGEREVCGLVQLRHSFDPTQMYGSNYGYRSGLNRSMVEHLRGIVAEALRLALPGDGDVVLDIGSNDGTLLGFYPHALRRIGIDPTAAKFRDFYDTGIEVVPDFFSAEAFLAQTGGQRAKVITSIAMMYDLPRPLDFVRDIVRCLDRDGVWVFEQSYLPTMIEGNSYDTICHEHLEYYSMRQIEWLLGRSGLKVIGVESNDTNGGSFRVVAAREDGPLAAAESQVATILRREESLGIESLETYETFRRRVFEHRDALLARLGALRAAGKRIAGYGASTKGNVILQFCGIGSDVIECIADVNPDKHGCVTPGSGIPIVSEEETHARGFDVLLVLPWHFRTFIVERERDFISRGGMLLFPLPEIDLVGR